jgi:2-dehydro-3-deoxyphosphooctonate aldolase (KDO 8-P synthase)
LNHKYLQQEINNQKFMIKDIPYIKNTDSGTFFLFAGPCVVESERNVFEIAEKALEITEKLKIPYVFKASYRKANRSKSDSFSGIGDTAALKILQKVRETLHIPIVTDIHTAEEAKIAAEYADILQIPAFLCRQTDLLLAAGNTGKIVNIKKGQFLAPESMKFAAEKVFETGNKKVMLTDRGTMFGYGDLIVDMRGIPEMQKTGLPVVMDVTHSLQQPNTSAGVTGGRPDLIETIARAAVAVGVDGLFIETHPNPAVAKSDGANMLKLEYLENLLTKLVKIRKTINEL